MYFLIHKQDIKTVYRPEYITGRCIQDESRGKIYTPGIRRGRSIFWY